MAYITNYQYYANGGVSPTDANWGSYQYITLDEIVTNFMLMYVGNDKLVNNVRRHVILFHAKRGIQELNYDSANEIKALELSIDDTLQMVLPPDYVNYVRISYERGGVLYPMIENKQLNWATSYLQDNNNDIVFDLSGNVIETTSRLEIERLAGNTQKIYLGGGQFYNQLGWNVGEDWYFTMPFTGAYGLNGETANINEKFRIDKNSGVIKFSSDISFQKVVLEYISDGMANGNEAEITVNKLLEEYIYAYIKYAIIKEKNNVPLYERQEAKKQKSALLRNAKIRLSNLHPSRILMVLRNQGNWIK